MKEYSFNDAEKHLSELLEEAQDSVIIINNNQSPSAVVISMEEYLYLLSLKQTQLETTLKYGFDFLAAKQVVDSRKAIELLQNKYLE